MDRKRVINELTRGRELAKQLQMHLNTPSSSSHDTQEILIHNILNSYDKSLSLLAASGINGNGSDGESHLFAGMGIARLESPRSFSGSPCSEDSDRDFKESNATKRKNNGSVGKWKNQVRVRGEMGVEGALDDGYTWRKYGQKDILGAKHPRGYYRCTYRQIQGCLATKQVQRTDMDPDIFDITYQGRHTCNPGSHASPPPSPPSLLVPREIQQPLPPQQNQLLRTPEIPSTLHPDQKVITGNLDTSSLDFPSTSNNNFIFATLDNTFPSDASTSFTTPTTSGSTYFTMSQPQVNGVERNPSVAVAESKLKDIVSIDISSTSAPMVDVGFAFDELEFGSNFRFDNSVFYN